MLAKMKNHGIIIPFIAWKVPKYGIFSGPNAGKYVPEKTPYLDTFHAVILSKSSYFLKSQRNGNGENPQGNVNFLFMQNKLFFRNQQDG